MSGTLAERQWRAWLPPLPQMMLIACVLGTVFGIGAAAVSYASDLPSGATIILLAGCVGAVPSDTVPAPARLQCSP